MIDCSSNQPSLQLLLCHLLRMSYHMKVQKKCFWSRILTTEIFSLCSSTPSILNYHLQNGNSILLYFVVWNSLPKTVPFCPFLRFFPRFTPDMRLSSHPAFHRLRHILQNLMITNKPIVSCFKSEVFSSCP